jgi:serine/threonine protein kinase
MVFHNYYYYCNIDMLTRVNFIALDLLEKMLVFDSQQRITAKQAIQHPYFDPYRNQVDEKIAVIPFDWSFTNTDLTSDMWRMMTSQEVLDFNNAPMTETAFASDSNHDSNK